MMVTRTQRHFSPYDAEKLLALMESAQREIGQYQATVPLNSAIHTALKAFRDAATLLADTARGDVGTGRSLPSHARSEQS